MSEENQNLTEPLAQKQPRRQIKLVLLGVLILAICAITVLIFYKQQSKNKIVVPAHLTLSQQSDYLAYKGDYAGAQKIVAAQVTKAPNATVKTGFYLQQASIAMNANNYTDAKTYAQAAEALQPSDNTISLLGYIAAATGDKATAKLDYQKAIDRLDKNAENYNTHLQDYQTRLQELDK